LGRDFGVGERGGGDGVGGSGDGAGESGSVGRTVSVATAQTRHERRRMRLRFFLNERVWGTRSDAQRGQGGGSVSSKARGCVVRAREA